MGAPGYEFPAALVGREAELDAVRSVIEQAARAQPRAVLIEGEAGIGKTRLLTEALTSAEGMGFRVLLGGCDEIEQEQPLRALVGALGAGGSPAAAQRPDLAELMRVGAGPPGRPVAVLGAVDGSWVIVEAVVDVLEDLASAGPVALAVENLQWADPLTLRVLHTVVRRLNRTRLVLLATVRSGSHGMDVDRAVLDVLTGGALHVVLGSLDPGAAAELAGAVAGLPPGPGLLEQVGRAGGNPLFVIELVRALADDGALEVRDGRVEARWESPPPTLRLTLLRRLSQLPEDGLNLLRIASVLGSTFSVAELTLLSGRTSAQLLPALTAALAAGLLSGSGDRLTFHHELVRDALYHDLPVAVRKGLHREVGVALGLGGASVERVAAHVVLGAETGDMEAVAWLQQAADTAVATAPATAVHLLRQALDISDAADVHRQVLAAEMVAPMLAAGRLREAEMLARSVLAEGPDRDVEILLRTGLAGVLSAGARYTEAINELERAASASPVRERVSLDAARSFLLVLAGQLERARDVAERTLVAADRRADDYARCLGLQTLAIVALAEGFVGDSVAKAQRAVDVAAGCDTAWASYVIPHLWYGTALCDADRFAEASIELHAGRRRAEQTGNVSRVPLYHWAVAELRLSSGQWDDALAEAQAGLGLIGETELQVGDVLAHALRAHVALHRGELSAAQAAVDEARRRLVAGPVEIGFEWMSWIAALLLEARGRQAQALATLAETWDLIAPVRYLQAAARAMGPDLVRMAKAAGDRQRAASVTDELERSSPRAGTPTARGLALRCRGLLDEDMGALLEAVAVHREGPRPYQLAAACEDAGVVLGRITRTNEAVALLSEATVIYERLHASWDLARVQAALRALGVRRTRPARRPTFGWESLTPTEVRVADLVAEGLTNPEIAERLFVSRRTVATHMEHVLRKLGHANRVELAADVARRAASQELLPSAASALGAARANPRSQAPFRPGG